MCTCAPANCARRSSFYPPTIRSRSRRVTAFPWNASRKSWPRVRHRIEIDRMTTEHISCETEGALLIVTLNRPDKLNAYTGQMGAELTEAFARADTDDGIRAVIVTGAGRAFCAGADVSGGATSFDTSGAHWGGGCAAPKIRGGRVV